MTAFQKTYKSERYEHSSDLEKPHYQTNEVLA